MRAGVIQAWQGPATVVAAIAVVLVLTCHVVHGLGDITRHVLGAAIEVTATLGYFGLVLG